MKKLMLIIFMTIVPMFLFNCQANIFDWMHPDGSATGEELVMEAEGYLNAGENSKALEYYEKAIPSVEGELKAKAIIGAMSAKYNLVFGEDGLFFLEAGLSLAKMSDTDAASQGTDFTTLLPASTWAGISTAYKYCKDKGYFSQLASISIADALERKAIMPMKTNGAFLSMLGGMAKMIDTLLDLAKNDPSISTNLEDISTAIEKMNSVDREAFVTDLVEAIVGGIGINTTDFNVDLTAIGANTGVNYEFTAWPFDNTVTNFTIKDKTKWTDFKKSVIATDTGIWTASDKKCEFPIDIHVPFGKKEVDPNVDPPTGENDPANKELCKTSDGKFSFYSNSKADSEFLSDLMMANANGGTGMDSIQEQLFGALTGMLYAK